MQPHLSFTHLQQPLYTLWIEHHLLIEIIWICYARGLSSSDLPIKLFWTIHTPHFSGCIQHNTGWDVDVVKLYEKLGVSAWWWNGLRAFGCYRANYLTVVCQHIPPSLLCTITLAFLWRILRLQLLGEENSSEAWFVAW